MPKVENRKQVEVQLKGTVSASAALSILLWKYIGGYFTHVKTKSNQ